MKTFRKALSVMLCLCMIMSAMAVGLNVFAQEKSEAVERFEANVKAFTGDVGKAEPSAEDLEAYEKLVAEYKALGNSDKESVDVMVFDVFYHHVVMRERQISIKNHPEISSSKKDHYINAAAQAVATLGYVPAYIDNAVELAKTIADRKISVDDKKAAWKAADYNTRVMAGGYGSTHGIISSSVKGDTSKGKTQFHKSKVRRSVIRRSAVPFCQLQIKLLNQLKTGLFFRHFVQPAALVFCFTLC